MRLTNAEFARIRPLRWSIQEYGGHGKIYNTLRNPIDVQLFWIDFVRNVFAGQFARQSGVTTIESFDITQPVLMSNDLELLLPTQLEAAMYFARNRDRPPVRFVALGISYRWVGVLAAAVLVLLLLLHVAGARWLERRGIPLRII